jgi:two-component sensor histidine kinase
VVRTGLPWRTDNYAVDPRISKEYIEGLRAEGRVAVVAVPIRIGVRIEGVLYVSNLAGRPFTERYEAMLLRLADLTATAIRNAQLYQTAQEELARRTQVEAQLKLSLREKEVLLKEIHHRVKNNLQVISSLLYLQMEAIADAQLRARFEEGQHRIQAMALIHETLYRSSDLAQVDFAQYLRTLTAHLGEAYSLNPQRIKLTVAVQEVRLSLDSAIPCGLLLNELLSNALKHAFPDGRSGEISIELRVEPPATGVLTVRDTGIGFPDAVDFRSTASLGLQLVCLLAEQLGGTLLLERQGGTHWTLRFPLTQT